MLPLLLNNNNNNNKNAFAPAFGFISTVYLSETYLLALPDFTMETNADPGILLQDLQQFHKVWAETKAPGLATDHPPAVVKSLSYSLDD